VPALSWIATQNAFHAIPNPQCIEKAIHPARRDAVGPIEVARVVTGMVLFCQDKASSLKDACERGGLIHVGPTMKDVGRNNA
jgi:hypothetical protein